MNLEQLNVVELSSEELIETTGGRIKPYTDADFIRDHGAEIFAVTNPLFW
ncbi:hypothetical protein [Sphingobacterium gobiense]|nr:hypothetical protein [Sphingobacterium gobiense]